MKSAIKGNPPAVTPGAIVVGEIAKRLRKEFDRNREHLADLMGWTRLRVDNFLDNETPNPWGLLSVAPRLADILHEKRSTLVQRLVEAFIPAGFPIAQRLATMMGDKGIQPEKFCEKLGMKLDLLLRILNGHNDQAPKEAQKNIAEILGISTEDLGAMVREARTRRKYPTAEIEKNENSVAISELLYEVCKQEKLSPTQFSAAHHFAPTSIRLLLTGQQIGRFSMEFIDRMAVALQVDRMQVIQGIRMNVPLPKGPHLEIVKRIQARLDLGDNNHLAVANEIGVHRSTVSGILSMRDLNSMNGITIHAIRVWLGMNWQEFCKCASEKPRNLKTVSRKSFTSAMPEEDAEIRLLKYYRKAPPERRAAALNLLIGATV